MKRRVELLSWFGNCLGKAPGFERLVRFWAPPEKCADFPEICLARDGTLFLTRLDGPLGWHIAFFGSYEPELREIMRIVLPAGGVTIDVGANIGWHTLLMARLVGNRGRVLAIEPNPSVREVLSRNIVLNQLIDIVDILPCALAESEQTLDFIAPAADDPASGSGHVVSGESRPSGSIRVAATTVDALADQKQINQLDLIKIDAEGLEWPILQGAEKTIGRFHPCVIFEFDEKYAVRGKDSPALFREFFHRHGYRLYSVRRNWAELVEDEAWPENGNIFATPLR